MSVTEDDRPALSVVIAVVSDTTGPVSLDLLASCLDGFSRQLEGPPVELIVAHLDHVEGVEALEERFAHVSFLGVPVTSASAGGREHHDVLRARGLLAARGRLLALVEDHARPHPALCANIVAAHEKTEAVIGGAIENGIDRPLNWAVYFCDFSRYQNPVPAGESPYVSDANVSYRRSTLHAILPIWKESFREVIVHEALRTRGEKLTLDPDIVVFQNRFTLTWTGAVTERFVWGRSYASTRNATLSLRRRIVHALATPVLPVVLTARAGRIAWGRRRLLGVFLRTAPLVVLLQVSWSIGECVGYVTGRAAATPPPAD